MDKGRQGYIDKRKTARLIKSLLAFGSSFLVLLIGYLLNDNSKQNIFTIVAVLIVLPATKILISYLILIPYRSASKEAYDVVVDKKDSNDIMYTDFVFSSSEKVMNLAFLVVKGNKIFGYYDHGKGKEKEIQDYLQSVMNQRTLPYRVKIINNFERFLKEIAVHNTIVEHDKGKEENKKEKELKETLNSLLV